MEQLVESIQSLGYHYVMIDCPAGIDVGFINAISPAKEALIVTTPEITSIRCAANSASFRPLLSGSCACNAATGMQGAAGY